MIRIPELRVGTKRLVILASAVITLALASLAFLLWTSPPHGGLTKAQAVQTAWTHVNDGATGVTSAEIRRNFDTGLGVPIHDWSWVVTFRGQWHLLCQGAPSSCDPTSEWVAIDYFTGDWIASQYSYPAP